METELNLFDYVAIDNKAERTLVLLHGTGGGKNDLLFFNGLLQNKYNIVSLQGNISENGMPRFFERENTGVFDQQSIKVETEKLNRFIQAWMKMYGLSSSNCYFLGYSNGANMLLASLFYYPGTFRNLVLLHPMIPFTPESPLDLSQHRIFVSGGLRDTTVLPAEQRDLVKLLNSYNAQLTVREYSSGHGIEPEELKDITLFLSS